MSQADKTLAAVLTDPDTYATTLLVVLVDRYGLEILEYAPETIALEVESDFGVRLPPLNHDKVMAAITVLTTNFFYKDVARFIELCNVLGGSRFDPTTFDPADSLECAWGITEALLLSPPEEGEEFDEQIRYYIAEMLRHEGFIKPPAVLRSVVPDDFEGAIPADLGNDPAMFAATYEAQSARSQEVDDAVKDNLQEMMQQIAALPLQSGDAKNFLSRVARHTGVDVAGSV